MQLWWALRPLTSVVRFMQTGAHPDDEISGMLAALAFRDGINLSYACSTRGEGGQNDIGREAGSALGALRTREMESACDVLGMRMYWHCTSPDDTITDFGFSKSGTETLERWGHERTLLRFAEIVRAERPDIICPTFLDVPGQHGHHRAMTQTAHEVMAAAADPDLPIAGTPWQVKKLYLPAWSGAGTSYDDDLPPPPATLTVTGTDREQMTGWEWNRIGQQSRSFHRTQGMGRWVPVGSAHDWPLHLAESHVGGKDQSLWSGMHKTLADLADLSGAKPIAKDIRDAQAKIDAAVHAFPDFEQVAAAATDALVKVKRALAKCPDTVHHEIAHRLEAKITQLGHVLRLALGIEARARVQGVFLSPRSGGVLEIESDKGIANSAKATLSLPKGWSVSADRIEISEVAVPTDPYRSYYDPIEPTAPKVDVNLTFNGVSTVVPLRLETEPVVLPASRVTLSSKAAVLNLSDDNRTVHVEVSDVAPKGGLVSLNAPTGWHVDKVENGFKVTAPAQVESGSYPIQALVNGQPAQSTQIIDYDHVGPTHYSDDAIINVGIFDIRIPQSKVGYIGAGNDRVGEWLSAIGADVENLTDADLTNEAKLADYDSIVIGIFAMRFRSSLVEAMPLLHRWTQAGGTLVTLYHRPWDNWDPDTIPPKPLEIGKPSLRWRVTNEAAKVTYLNDHPVLSHPNAITDADWAGWHKERGLYFAKSWDVAYTPLLSMADEGEEPLSGALLVADIGKGRHVHTSLILHHQMNHLVSGAFRLMANLISPRES